MPPPHWPFHQIPDFMLIADVDNVQESTEVTIRPAMMVQFMKDSFPARVQDEYNSDMRREEERDSAIARAASQLSGSGDIHYS